MPGAPEVDSSRSETRTPHGQTIDIWSFGCILSRAATWVVLGPQGILQNDWVRREAIQRLRQGRRKDSQGRPVAPTADDAFHDGKTVLPVVLQWHKYLRSIARKSDTICPKVLDLVDTKMLLEHPNERVSSSLLCAELHDIVVFATAKVEQDELSRRVDDSLLEALYKFDSEAGDNQTPAPQPKSAKLSKAEKRKGKSQLYDILPARTAHRAEMLHQKLKESTFIMEAVNESPTNTAVELNSHQGPVFEHQGGYSHEPEDIEPGITDLPLRPSLFQTGQEAAKPGVNYQEGPMWGRASRGEQSRHPGMLDSPAVGVIDRELHEQHDGPAGNGEGLSLGEKSNGKMPQREGPAESYTVDDGVVHEPVSQIISTSHSNGARDTGERSTRRDSKIEPSSSLLPYSYFSTVPPPAISASYDIHGVRQALEQSRSRFLGRYKVDPFLKRFVDDRDMVSQFAVCRVYC